MTPLIFVTGNARKIKEAQSTLNQFDIRVEPVSVDIDEIQHHDSAKVTEAKARAAYAVVDAPVVVQDTSWNIPALGGFPGAYMKDVAEWWQPEDWLQLMQRHADKTIECHEHVAYYDGAALHHTQAVYVGNFVDTPAGIWGNSIEKVVNLYGAGTLAQMHDATGIASAGEELAHWLQFGQWYKQSLTLPKNTLH